MKRDHGRLNPQEGDNGSCNGLVLCLHKQKYSDLGIVCNPLTGEFVFLQRCTKGVEQYGEFEGSAIVLDVGSDSWRSIGDSPFSSSSTSIPVFLNGVLHWVCDVNNTPRFVVYF
ncbi:hypothetical protein POM88_008238 [Heracleum sosnowskyi]|uniref:F-box protein n=1 Tax=Heracleum sosnowskyi TaxID=360622 RepID=A0AAD8J5U0_9APIA|nr:hypothetical protein POM88_008238 [Heracleum sosnowskyi]